MPLSRCRLLSNRNRRRKATTDPPANDETRSDSQLEADLMAVRENLRLSIEQMEVSNEELRASDEEIRSINKELQASNEELETSKEELQSLNEELNTVDSQLQAQGPGAGPPI